MAAFDGTLLAVVELVCCYSSTFHCNEVSSHITGLLQLVRMRGGLSRIPAFLAYRTIMADNVVAAMIDSKPLLQDAELPDAGAFTTPGLNVPSQRNISDTFMLMKQAIERINFMDNLNATILLFERKLLNEIQTLRASDTSPSTLQCCPIISEAVRVALIIYIELNIADTWRYSAVLAALVARLQALLSKTRIKLFWIPYTEALLLVILLGGVGSIGHLDRKWYVNTLRQLLKDLDVDDFSTTVRGLGIADTLMGDTRKLMEALWVEAAAIELANEVRSSVKL